MRLSLLVGLGALHVARPEGCPPCTRDVRRQPRAWRAARPRALRSPAGQLPTEFRSYGIRGPVVRDAPGRSPQHNRENDPTLQALARLIKLTVACHLHRG